MKNQIPIILLTLCFCLFSASAALTLVETNNTSVTGKIISFSQKTGLVKIQTDTGIVQRSESAFTEESQSDITHWLADKNFRVKSKMNASFRDYDYHSSSNITGTITGYRNEKREGIIGRERRTFYSCRVKLTNKTKTPFNNLEINYRIFYTQPLTKELAGHYQLAGSTTCECLGPNQPWEFKTNPVLKSVIHTEAATVIWNKMPKNIYSKIEGTLLCIRKQDVTGKWIEHEIEYGEVPRKRQRSTYQKVYE